MSAANQHFFTADRESADGRILASSSVTTFAFGFCLLLYGICDRVGLGSSPLGSLPACQSPQEERHCLSSSDTQ